MKKKLTLTKVKERAWTQFSLYIRLRDSLKTVGNNRQCKCISCGNIVDTRGRAKTQAGHFIPGRNNKVLFDEEQVHGQCYHCNIGLKGNWVPYERAMVTLYGRKKVEKMKLESKEKVKYTVNDLLEIEAKYKQKIKDLGGFD